MARRSARRLGSIMAKMASRRLGISVGALGSSSALASALGGTRRQHHRWRGGASAARWRTPYRSSWRRLIVGNVASSAGGGGGNGGGGARNRLSRAWRNENIWRGVIGRLGGSASMYRRIAAWRQRRALGAGLGNNVAARHKWRHRSRHLSAVIGVSLGSSAAHRGGALSVSWRQRIGAHRRRRRGSSSASARSIAASSAALTAAHLGAAAHRRRRGSRRRRVSSLAAWPRHKLILPRRRRSLMALSGAHRRLSASA